MAPVQILAAAAIGLLIAASIFVAVRLLALHRRTGAWPELLLAGMLLLSVGVGYPLRIAADQAGPEWAGGFLVGSYFAIALGFALLFVFTWRVFRPSAAWARAFAAAGVLVGLGNALHGTLQVLRRGAIDMLELPVGEILLETVPIAIAYVWTAWESLRYYAAMRRRAKLGLADAIVSDRFRLWGVMAMCATVGVTSNVAAVVLRIDMQSPAVLLVSSLFGLGQATALLLAFVPPRAYLAWVRARAAVAGE